MVLAADTTINVMDKVNSWVKQPFSTTMGVGGWFAFFGLVAVITVAWGIILKELKGDL